LFQLDRLVGRGSLDSICCGDLLSRSWLGRLAPVTSSGAIRSTVRAPATFWSEVRSSRLAPAASLCAIRSAEFVRITSSGEVRSIRVGGARVVQVDSFGRLRRARSIGSLVRVACSSEAGSVDWLQPLPQVRFAKRGSLQPLSGAKFTRFDSLQPPPCARFALLDSCRLLHAAKSARFDSFEGSLREVDSFGALSGARFARVASWSEFRSSRVGPVVSSGRLAEPDVFEPLPRAKFAQLDLSGGGRGGSIRSDHFVGRCLLESIRSSDFLGRSRLNSIRSGEDRSSRFVPATLFDAVGSCRFVPVTWASEAGSVDWLQPLPQVGFAKVDSLWPLSEGKFARFDSLQPPPCADSLG
jgi:hypothetical protein